MAAAAVLRRRPQSKGCQSVKGRRAVEAAAADKARTARAVARAVDVRELQAAGVTSLNAIAAALDERGVPTPAGNRHWHAAQVARVLKRLSVSFPL